MTKWTYNWFSYINPDWEPLNSVIHLFNRLALSITCCSARHGLYDNNCAKCSHWAGWLDIRVSGYAVFPYSSTEMWDYMTNFGDPPVSPAMNNLLFSIAKCLRDGTANVNSRRVVNSRLMDSLLGRVERSGLEPNSLRLDQVRCFNMNIPFHQYSCRSGASYSL